MYKNKDLKLLENQDDLYKMKYPNKLSYALYKLICNIYGKTHVMRIKELKCNEESKCKK